MARIRSIKPEFWEDEKLGRLSLLARLNFIGLISLADDRGRGRGDPAYLAARLHAYSSSIQGAHMEDSLRELETSGVVRFYTVEGQRFYELPNFLKHQQINRPSPSKLPPPPGIVPEPSGGTPAPVTEDSQAEGIKDQGREGIRECEGDSSLKPSARNRGTNPRALGVNLRALGVNPRALGTNPKALTRQTVGFDPAKPSSHPPAAPGEFQPLADALPDLPEITPEPDPDPEPPAPPAPTITPADLTPEERERFETEARTLTAQLTERGLTRGQIVAKLAVWRRIALTAIERKRRIPAS